MLKKNKIYDDMEIEFIIKKKNEVPISDILLSFGVEENLFLFVRYLIHKIIYNYKTKKNYKYKLNISNYKDLIFSPLLLYTIEKLDSHTALIRLGVFLDGFFLI
jgi:hypothetical protein